MRVVWHSSVTRVATRHVSGVVDLVVVPELLTQRRTLFAFGMLPFHVSDSNVFGTQMRFRSAVAFKAPAHAQRSGLEDNVHAVDPAMAFDAAHAVIDVGAVIEVNVIGQVMNLDPLDRFAGLPAIADGLEQ